METTWLDCAVTVEIRQAGNEWHVEVGGVSIGSAESRAEARVLAAHWQARMRVTAGLAPLHWFEPRPLPTCLTDLLDNTG